MRRDESGIETHSQVTQTCKRHHTKLKGQICSVCEHRSEYMVHGYVDIFDEGFRDGYACRPNTQSSQYARAGHHEQAANYQDGWTTGSQTYRENHPIKESKAPVKDQPVIPGKARYSLMPIADGSAALLTRDGIPFAALLGSDRKQDLHVDTASVIGQEITTILNAAQGFGTRPSRLVRMDRGNRYQEECERNRLHITKTIALNLRLCREKAALLKHLVQRQDRDALTVACELYASRAFVLGLIEARGHALNEAELTKFKRFWEDPWDAECGDLVGKALHMQD